MNSKDDQTEFSLQFEQLTRTFREQLDQRIEQLEQLHLAHVEGDSEAAETLRIGLHKLAGSCATFGLKGTGKHARRIELEMISWQAPEQARPEWLRDELQQLRQQALAAVIELNRLDTE